MRNRKSVRQQVKDPNIRKEQRIHGITYLFKLVSIDVSAVARVCSEP